MHYPKDLNTNDNIGLVAPSLGSPLDPYKIRLDQAISFFTNNNYQIIKGNNLYNIHKAASDTGKNRAKDFMKMYKDPTINLIWSIAGGEIMMDILPFINFSLIAKSKAKYFVGFSDNTNLTFLITTLCDIATVYGMCFGEFGVRKLHQQNYDVLNLLTGKELSFKSYDKYQIEDLKYEDPLSPLNLTKKVSWNCLNYQEVTIKGRIIGGCLDILAVICGTKFDKVKDFIEKYKEDGIIWYLDSCDYNSTGFYRALLQLSYAGWFKYVKGFFIGRTNNTTEIFDFTFKDAMKKALLDYHVPVIYNVDVGHVAPQLPILNGSIATINYINHEGTITFEKK